jgi:hypothetical protein
MGILIKVIKKKIARGKSNNEYAYLTFGYKGVFDIPYESAVHKRFVLNEIRSLTGQTMYRRERNRMLAFKVKEARRWREAIDRNAPLLSGFFRDEPEWRDKMLAWCERMLAKRQR